MTGDTSPLRQSPRVPANRRKDNLVPSGVEAVLCLADGLPQLDDVQEVDENDDSALTQAEQGQLQQTEDVIDAALAAGDAAVWVIAQGLERAARGRWWRATHPSLETYVHDRIGHSAGYVRRLRLSAPLALETARRTGTVPKPAQAQAVRKTQKQHGLDAAVTLFEVVRHVAVEFGGRATAKDLRAVHDRLPETLPLDNEAQWKAIERVARKVFATPSPDAPQPDLGMRQPAGWGVEQAEPKKIEYDSNGSAPIGALPFESYSNIKMSGATAAEEAGVPGSAGSVREIQNGSRESLGILAEALSALAVIDEKLTSEVYAQAAADLERASECERLRQHIIIRAAAIRAKALRAPAT
jgi:hypothetical protein